MMAIAASNRIAINPRDEEYFVPLSNFTLKLNKRIKIIKNVPKFYIFRVELLQLFIKLTRQSIKAVSVYIETLI